jgi:hypothetical protein
MNKLWILRPIPVSETTPGAPLVPSPWVPWYDKTFGMVIRAVSERSARSIAAEHCADEGEEVWLNSEYSSCVELLSEGNAGVIMVDHARA